MLVARASSPVTLRWPAAWRWAAAVGALLATAVVAAREVDGPLLVESLQSAATTPQLLLVIAAAYAAAFWLRALAWRALLRTPTGTRDLHAILQTSLFLNHVLPVKAGEVARPALAHRRGIPAAEALATTVVARTLDFACLAVLAGVAVSAYTAAGGLGAAARAAVVAVVALVTTLVFLSTTGSRHLPGRPGVVATRASEALRAVPRGGLALAAALTMLSWVLEATVVFGAAHFAGVELSARAAIGVTAITILFQAVHFTPGGLGMYEASMTAALVSQGVLAEEALGVAVLSHGLKFAFAFVVGGPYALVEGLSLLRGHAGEPSKTASRLEVVAARLWNILNEGKPFTAVFTATVLLAVTSWTVDSAEELVRWLFAAACIIPLALVFWRFDFPLRLRATLWVLLASFLLLTRELPLEAVSVALAAYVFFTVVMWGTVYYHLRIGTPWTNGLRFVRLVAENPDPTSGNFLEQVPKILLLVLAFEFVRGGSGVGEAGTLLAFTAVTAGVAVLAHQWWFRWVPALPQPRLAIEPPTVPERTARRVIVIAIDGCRADRLLEAITPCIDQLRTEGIDYRNMATVYPARTVTCFSSMLTGASPAVHGMKSNFVPSLGVKCETVFDVLRSEGMRGQLVGIAHLIDAFGERDVRTVTAVMDNDAIDDALIAEAKRVMADTDPELLVLQLLSVDQTGHARGSYNQEYLAKIEETDAKIASFLRWCDGQGLLDDTLVVLTADHGQGIGIGGHGHMSPTEINIPCVFWGAGVEAGRAHDQQVFITDIAATICSSLGVRAPRESVGRPLIPQQLLAAELHVARPEEATELSRNVLHSRPAPDSASMHGREESAHGDQRPVVFVVPARDEHAALPGVLAAIDEAGVHPYRVVVVDDGSRDRTAEVARAAGATVYSHPSTRGLGAALRSGLMIARGMHPRAVVYLDGDGEYDAREAAPLLAPIERGEADYVVGYRSNSAAGGMRLSRRVANRAFTLALAVLAGRRIRDGQSGFRAFSPRAADVAEIIHDYNYAQVLTLDLLKKGMRMVEVPVTYRRRATGRSFVRPEYLWRVPLGMAREVLNG